MSTEQERTLVGTAYYQSRAAAYRYYDGDVELALQEERIKIGLPPGDGKYVIQEGRYHSDMHSTSEKVWPTTDAGRLREISAYIVDPTHRSSLLIHAVVFLGKASQDARYSVLWGWMVDILCNSDHALYPLECQYLMGHGFTGLQLIRMQKVWTVMFLRKLIDTCEKEDHGNL